MIRCKSSIVESGFTLLELLVAMTVAALLLTIVAPRLTDTVSHASLRATASRVVAALRETRWDAMKTSTALAFAINTSGQGFIVADKVTALTAGQTISLTLYD